MWLLSQWKGNSPLFSTQHLGVQIIPSQQLELGTLSSRSYRSVGHSVVEQAVIWTRHTQDCSMCVYLLPELWYQHRVLLYIISC